MVINDFPTNSEYFRAIDGFPNYEISTDGRVRTIKTGRMRKLNTEKDGYITVGLLKDKKVSSHRVHRLVATALCIKLMVMILWIILIEILQIIIIKI